VAVRPVAADAGHVRVLFPAHLLCEQPSLGLHGQSRLSDARRTLLAENHIDPLKQIAQGGRMALVFASQGAATGQAVAGAAGLDSAALTLEFYSNAPA
jgi:preprotein translocase subunit SecD